MKLGENYKNQYFTLFCFGCNEGTGGSVPLPASYVTHFKQIHSKKRCNVAGNEEGGETDNGKTNP